MVHTRRVPKPPTPGEPRAADDVRSLRVLPHPTRAPAGLSLALLALWHERKGDWDAAHRLAQAEDDRDGAWVHAYLHRVEGDHANAAYWYRRAGRPAVSDQPLGDEWAAIVKALLTA